MKRYVLRNSVEFQKRINKIAFGSDRTALERKALPLVLKTLSIWQAILLLDLRESGFIRAMEQTRINFLRSGSLQTPKNRRLLVTNVWNSMLPEKPSTSRIVDILLQIADKSFTLGATGALEDLGFTIKAVETVTFELTNEAVILALEARALEMTSIITSTVVRDAQSLVSRAIFEDGMTVDAAISALEAQGISPARAQTIANTEVQAGLGRARNMMFTQSGVTRRRWITVGDNRVRPRHTMNESAGWITALTYPDGSPHPGSGPSSVNCRCIEEPDLSDPNIILDPWLGA